MNQTRNYLQSILYTPEEVKSLVLGTSPSGEKYDPELGWISSERRAKHGMDGSVVTYRFDASGARRMIMYADRPCRINTYGDSFTECSQVNDGETWQELLAAHLIEPIRNCGVGGYSVYQAYLRMKREESRTPARHIIFNMYEDDHTRNLHSWRMIRGGQTAQMRAREGVWGAPMPFVKANPATGQFEEFSNPCPTAESLAKLNDIDWAYETFKDDFVLKIVMAKKNVAAGTPEKSYADITELAGEQGLDVDINTSEALAWAVDSLHARAGLFASTRIVQKVEEFAAIHKRKVLYVLSYSGSRALERGPRFDQPLIDFMMKKQLPYIDLLEAHQSELDQFSGKPEDYIQRYWVGHHGHYSPRGNFFQAFAIKDKLVDVLYPKPIPYRS